MSAPDTGLQGDVDLRSPLFFLSYAHTNTRQEPNWRFIKFFEDLSENVAELVVRSAGSDPGYMDRSIPNGGRWTGELLTAIGTCQTFVALLSPLYLKSKWCAYEWHAFAQRQVVSRREGVLLSNQAAIIPVIWAPIRDQEIPEVIGKVQRFNPHWVPQPKIDASYENDGVVGLLQLSDDTYRAVVWRLAQGIADLLYTHTVTPHIVQFANLRNIFEE
jgi:TIR domain